MSKRYPLIVVSDMLACIEEMKAFTAGYTYEQFIQDAKTFKAVLANVLILGEAANQVDEQTKVMCPEVPWEKVRGTRNRLIHEYFDIDSQILWQIASVEAPLLQAPLENLLVKLPQPPQFPSL